MTTVINTPPNTIESDNSSGWAMAVIILLAVIGVGIYFWFNYRTVPAAKTGDTNINVTLPPGVLEQNSGKATTQ